MRSVKVIGYGPAPQSFVQFIERVEEAQVDSFPSERSVESFYYFVLYGFSWLAGSPFQWRASNRPRARSPLGASSSMVYQPGAQPAVCRINLPVPFTGFCNTSLPF